MPVAKVDVNPDESFGGYEPFSAPSSAPSSEPSSNPEESSGDHDRDADSFWFTIILCVFLGLLFVCLGIVGLVTRKHQHAEETEKPEVGIDSFASGSGPAGLDSSGARYDEPGGVDTGRYYQVFPAADSSDPCSYLEPQVAREVGGTGLHSLTDQGVKPSGYSTVGEIIEDLLEEPELAAASLPNRGSVDYCVANANPLDATGPSEEAYSNTSSIYGLASALGAGKTYVNAEPLYGLSAGDANNPMPPSEYEFATTTPNNDYDFAAVSHAAADEGYELAAVERATRVRAAAHPTTYDLAGATIQPECEGSDGAGVQRVYNLARASCGPAMFDAESTVDARGGWVAEQIARNESDAGANTGTNDLEHLGELDILDPQAVQHDCKETEGAAGLGYIELDGVCAPGQSTTFVTHDAVTLGPGEFGIDDSDGSLRLKSVRRRNPLYLGRSDGIASSLRGPGEVPGLD